MGREIRSIGRNHRESEIAFVITDNGHVISRDLGRIKSTLQYDLIPSPPKKINDTYYDTLDRSLQRKRTILRIRKVDHVTLLTVKSGPQTLKGKGVERTEVELPWSRKAVAKAVKQLKLGKSVAEQSKFSKLSPEDALAAYGLEAVQDRRTKRKVRNIVPNGRQGPVLAELVIDETTFALPRTHIRIFEMEIEAKNVSSFRPIQRIADAISSTYPESLRYWTHGKFVTGLAIQYLLERGKLQRHVLENVLRADAFPLIDRTIRSGRLQTAQS